MKLVSLLTTELIWCFDFSPRSKWPRAMPCIAASHNSECAVIAGFDRRNQTSIECLILDGKAPELMREIWPQEELQAFENLRFQKVLGEFPQGLSANSLDFPPEFQNYFDGKGLGLKAMRPMEYLVDWKEDLSRWVLKLAPSSSQLRELLDLLCDLKMTGLKWEQCRPSDSDADSWVLQLRRLRTPLALGRDEVKGKTVQSLSWPKGVRAKWERQGDLSGLLLQVRLSNHSDWRKFRENLADLDLEKALWNS